MRTLFVWAALILCVQGDGWGYPDNSGWGGVCVSGSEQSPINLVDDIEAALGPISFVNYDFTGWTSNFTIEDNGHTVVVTPPDAGNNHPGIQYGLSSFYWVAQFHWHWGSVSSRGSEHTLDGDPKSAELHIVHVKEGYDSIGAALDSHDGDALAVLGIFIEVEVDDNQVDDSDASSNTQKYVNTILPSKVLASVVDPDTSSSYQGFALDMLLPDDLDEFYRYYGSLTTPPCSEQVVWTVFQTNFPVREATLEAFRSLLDSHHRPLEDNFRSIQSLNDRNIYENGI